MKNSNKDNQNKTKGNKSTGTDVPVDYFIKVPKGTFLSKFDWVIFSGALLRITSSPYIRPQKSSQFSQEFVEYHIWAIRIDKDKYNPRERGFPLCNASIATAPCEVWRFDHVKEDKHIKSEHANFLSQAKLSGTNSLNKHDVEYCRQNGIEVVFRPDGTKWVFNGRNRISKKEQRFLSK